jgi:magnesium-transporting ATPase (P-type)
VATRAFGVLGPTEATMSMLAFFAVFLAAGWRPGEPFPGGDVLLAASGATFVAVALGQFAASFACRSTTRWAGALGWGSNRLLVWAVAAEAVVVAVFLFVPPVADLLDHAPASTAGWAVALATGPVVIAVDAAWKRRTRARRAVRAAGGGG